MEFLYPQFLYGLAALAIPIIIHLFNFRKAKRVYFSNNFFLKNLKKISSSKLKLKHYLILAARLLFITFLVLAFAQPFVPASKKNLSNENVLIYLDNSYSMSNEVASGLSAFEQAIGYVNQITGLYPPSTSYKFLTNDFAPFSNTFKSQDEIEEIITEIEFSGVTRTFSEINNRLTDANLSPANRNDVYFISDFQQSTSGNLQEVAIDTNFNFYLVPMNYQKSSNIYVDSIYLENPFLMVNENNILRVLLTNNGNQDLEEVSIKLFVNEVQTANLTLDIQANSQGNIEFPLNFGMEKINKCRLSIEDYPVTFDNDFYFTLNLSDRIKILEIKDQDEITNIGRVYANQSLFNLLSYHISNLDYSLINDMDLIVLNGLGKVDNALESLISTFVEEGGAILVIPSEIPDLSFLSRLSGRQFSINQEAEIADLASPPLQNPFYENIFEASQQDFSMPKATNMLSWSDRSNALLSFKDQTPYLSQFDNGSGKLYILASPLQESYTTFFKHAVFVPIMYRMAALSNEVANDLYYSLNQNIIEVQLDSVDRSQIYKLVTENRELIPAQQQNGNTLLLDIPKFEMNAGIYQLVANEQTVNVLAFNQDESESKMSQMAPEELKAAFKNYDAVEIFNFTDAEDFGREMKSSRLGTPYWKYALILSLFFIFTEIVLIRFL